MRVLVVDAQYSAFLQDVYEERPELTKAPYDEQLLAIHDGLFGEARFQADALRSLGHEAVVVVSNAVPAQRAWAVEHGLDLEPGLGFYVALRRGIVPWPRRRPSAAYWAVLLAQVDAYRPDVIYVEILDTLPLSVAHELKRRCRLLVAQIAAAYPTRSYDAYDLVLSSIPDMVDDFRSHGIRSELVPLAFEPRILEWVPPQERDLPVTLIGSLGKVHQARGLLAQTVARVAPLQIWTSDASGADLAAKERIVGRAFGRKMYEVLGRSRITLNSHARVSGENANNLRLYEATGMGALLVTDAKRNLVDLFHVGAEVITYRRDEEAAEAVQHYLEHPREADEVASAGQRRTLRDHTWLQRMEAFTKMAESYLRSA